MIKQPLRAFFRCGSLLLLVAACSPNGPADPRDGGPDSGHDGGPPQCPPPSHVRIEVGDRKSRIDVGWTGGSHGIKFNQGTEIALEVTGCDATCRRCSIRGPVLKSGGVPYRRCTTDPRQVCGGSAECPAFPCEQNNSCPPGLAQQEKCVFMVGPPISRAGRCIQVTFAPATTPDPSPLQGAVDFETGALNFSVFNMLVRITLGGECPACQGDNALYDGQADGTCVDAPAGPGAGNPYKGQSCDVGGISWFQNGFLSLDCPAAGYPVIFSLPLRNIGTDGVSWQMDDRRPFCSGAGVESQRCWCGTCTNDGRAACETDRDCGGATCAGATVGDAGVPTIGGHVGVPTRPNLCSGGVCDWDPSARQGGCIAAAGTPLEGAEVGCFKNSGTLEAVGKVQVLRDVYLSTIAGLFCFPPSGSIDLDGLAGYPGPALIEVPMKVTKENR